MTLTDEQKGLLKRYKSLLQHNDIEQLYKVLPKNERGSISQFFLENGINFMEYFDHKLPEYTFSNSEIESITIPDNITTIGEKAFHSCSNLKEVNIGNSVKYINNDAFSFCTALNELFLPESVAILGSDVFRGDDNIKIFTPKRSSGNRLKCKQGEIPWYKEHLFMQQTSDNEE